MAPEAPPPEVDLRPLSTSELIDRGFSLYRQNFAGLLLLALLGQAAPLLAQVVTGALHLMPSMEDMARRVAPRLRQRPAFLCDHDLRPLAEFLPHGRRDDLLCGGGLSRQDALARA